VTDDEPTLKLVPTYVFACGSEIVYVGEKIPASIYGADAKLCVFKKVAIG
jgi:hypothetical protein